MAEEDYGLVPYKNISELKKDLDGIREKKDISSKDVHDAMRRLADTMDSMLEVFGAAAEQMKLEEKEYDSESKKHEIILSKLDKLLEQNKTIAEGMVAVVEMFKEKFPQSERQEPIFAEPRKETLGSKEPDLFISQQKTPWTPEAPKPQAPPISQSSLQQPALTAPPIAPIPSQDFGPSPDFGMQMPPMEPAPMPDFDFPEEPFNLGADQKKKGLFGMFKK